MALECLDFLRTEITIDGSKSASTILASTFQSQARTATSAPTTVRLVLLGKEEATQTLSNELGKTDGWKYLENLDQVDVKAIEEAFAVGFFGGGAIRGATDTVTGKNPEDFAQDNQKIKDKQLMGALESVEKGGGLTTEPTIPVTEPVLEKS